MDYNNEAFNLALRGIPTNGGKACSLAPTYKGDICHTHLNEKLEGNRMEEMIHTITVIVV